MNTIAEKIENYLKKYSLIQIFFVVFVATYALILIINPQLGPTDDYVFLRTLQSDKPLLYYSQSFPYYDARSMGRFIPLAGIEMEYNLVALFSHSPFWYFFYHAVQFILLAILFIKLLNKFTSNKLLIYGAPILLFLTPGFTISWFRLQLSERNVIFYFTIFLLCYLYYFQQQRIWYFIAGLISANFAIYHKETAFIAIGAFAFSHLILSWKDFNRKIKIFDGLLLLSSFIYIAIYYFYAYLHLGSNLYLNTLYSPFLVFVKNFLNYGFFSDPLLILLLLPMTVWRMYKIFIKHQESQPIYDSMLLAASMYVAAFFVLNMYSPYYLLPAYIFVLPPLFYFLSQAKQKILFWKIAGVITGFLLIFNVLPSGIHYLTYYKYLSVNFNKTTSFLIQDINSKHPDKRANIFFDGVNRNTGRATYFVLAEFLQFEGFSHYRFDLKSDVETKNASSLITKIPTPFTVFQTDKTDKIVSGDYLIVSPQNTRKDIDKKYLQSFDKDYQLVFQAKSQLAFPNLNLKTLIKYFLSKKLSQSQKAGGVVVNENLMDLPDYYVFVKK